MIETMAPTFRSVVSSEEELREVLGQPSDLVIRKQLPTLDRHARTFIAHAPFALIGTSNRDGGCDVSPRGDGPGFVEVLDDSTLAIPERPGNRRADSLRNIIENPHVGLLFMIPNVEETLRVNGRAQIVRDEKMLDRMAVRGKRPLLAIAVEVEEVFLHCAKAFKRSGLWQPENWPARSELPSLAEMLMDQVKPAGTTVEELDCAIEDGYQKRLY
ncbi:MAG: pyridoxamine 5'-phosphate oxidase family protein [Thermomicrobiales bacterium]